ncbi:MAG TPA: hypothetical protein VLM91_03345 [Candidatus Methylomirabilis sp.]|nr:hypothetical protein [Candidatus Methylomirabilis sp.]
MSSYRVVLHGLATVQGYLSALLTAAVSVAVAISVVPMIFYSVEHIQRAAQAMRKESQA